MIQSHEYPTFFNTLESIIQRFYVAIAVLLEEFESLDLSSRHNLQAFIAWRVSSIGHLEGFSHFQDMIIKELKLLNVNNFTRKQNENENQIEKNENTENPRNTKFEALNTFNQKEERG